MSRNAEKRKEKSRDAARNRRCKEADVFMELSSMVPISADTVASMDKASVMRIAISHVKLRTLMHKRELESQTKCDALLNREYLSALGGFIVLLDDGGDIMYVSDDVTKVLGINQLELLGSNLYDFTHPCDHEELRDTLEEKDAEEDCRAREHMFFLRHKCTITAKGRSVNLKSATYKVIRYTGHHIMTHHGGCLVLIGESIPQPSSMSVPMDSFSFLTQHSMDLRFNYCDERMSELLGYDTEEVMSQPLCEFHHAWDGEAMEKSLKCLFSKGQMWTDRYRFLAKGGGYVWVETQATVIHNAKTDKAQGIVCVHYVLSGIENPGCVMSQVQVKLEKPAAVKVAMMSRKTAVVRPTIKPAAVMLDGAAMHAGTVYGEGCQELCGMPHGLSLSQIGAVNGENMLLDPEDADVVNLLEDVLFHEIGVDLRTNVCNPVPSKCNDLAFTGTLASLDMNDDVMSENEVIVRCKPALAPNKCAIVDGVPNLEHLADNPRVTSANAHQLKEEAHLLKEQQTPVDCDDVDMDMRAPYIPMSGDEDLVFSMMSPVPLIDEMENATGMLGITETIFAPNPEVPVDDVNAKKQIPMYILRAEAMRKQASQLTGLEVTSAQTQPKVNAPTETNRLETGPPAAKRCRVQMDSDDDDYYYSSPSSCASLFNMVDPDEVLAGSMVLKNLLVSGSDATNGYDVYNFNIKPQPTEKPAETTTLRGLLTGPMENLSPPTSPVRINAPHSDVTMPQYSPSSSNQGSSSGTNKVNRITIRTVGNPGTDANQIVLTDDIIKMLIKHGEAEVLIGNQ